jgi:hypothetical protein
MKGILEKINEMGKVLPTIKLENGWGILSKDSQMVKEFL